MSNMSYCRFENTARDLVDCREALTALFDGAESPLSDTELASAKRLGRVCLEIVEMLAAASGNDDDLIDHLNARNIADALDQANANALPEHQRDEEEDE